MKFLMDFIMPPFKSAKYIMNLPFTKNNYSIQTLQTIPGISYIEHNCGANYSTKVLKNLHQQRQNSLFCDVNIIAGDKIFKAHKAILAASSNYFQAMFTGGLCEKDQNSVELHAIAPNVLEMLINFIYSGEVSINQNNVQELLVAADMLELHEVVKGCSDFLIKELHPINAIGIFRFADAHNCSDLVLAAYEYILDHFTQICQEDELYELSKDEVILFLQSEQIKVESEFEVFQAAIRWITHDILDRRRFVFEILKHVRLPLFPLGLLERAINDCSDSSLKVALKSVHNDLINRKGCLVSLTVHPRIRAKKYIYVIGGNKRDFVWHRESESYCASVVKFDTFTKEWTQAPDLITNRIVPGVTTMNGKIYVVGGEQESNCLNNCEYYDPQTNCWSTISDMCVPRCEFGLCALNGYLYALGGWIGDDIGGSIERYDTKTDSWKHVGIMPEPRFSMGVVAYNGLIYMVGGCTKNRRHLCDLLSFDPLNGEWRTLPSMSVERSQMGVAVLDDQLYVIGGDNKHSVLASVERYSFKNNKWSSLPSMSVARSRPAVAAIDGLIYVIGGAQIKENFYRAQCTLASVECFDIETNAWTHCPSLPESRAESGAVVL